MHLLFDFDGTLVDSFDCVVETFMRLADEMHFRKIKKEEIEDLRNLSSTEFVKFLNIPLYQIPTLIYRTRKYLFHEMHRLQPVADMPYILQQLSKTGSTLGILTSNSAANVKLWLKQHHLQDVFSFIYIESSFFSKKNLLKRILKKHKIPLSQAYYIGDETRDIEAANQNQIRSIAVTWGYNSEKALTKAEPYLLIRRPQDLLRLFRRK